MSYGESISINRYLNDIGRIPLLTPVEEGELAAKIIKGKYIEVKEIILGIVTGERIDLSVIDMVELTNSLSRLSKENNDIGNDILTQLKKLESIAASESTEDDEKNQLIEDSLPDVEEDGEISDDDQMEAGLLFSPDAIRTYPLTQELRASCSVLADTFGWKEVSLEEIQDKLKYRVARDQMIKANLRLVVNITKSFIGRGLPHLDLISEGNIGLMKACERFDPSKGGKLSTYASWWIKQASKSAIYNKSRDIRIPVDVIKQIWKMRAVETTMIQELGRPPSKEELRTRLILDPKKFAHLISASMSTVSLDAPRGDEDDGEFGETISHPDDEDASEIAAIRDMLQRVPELLKSLSERERFILEELYGIKDEDGKGKTLEQVGLSMSPTIKGERVRQLKNIALKKLEKTFQDKHRLYEKIREENAGRSRDEDEVGEKTPRSPHLNDELLRKAGQQLAVISLAVPSKPQKNKHAQKRKVTLTPSESKKAPLGVKNGVVKKASKELTPAQKEKLQSLILGASLVKKSGTEIKDMDSRFIMMNTYLGRAGSEVHTIPEIARDMGAKEEDIQKTLESMAPDFLKK